VTLRSERAVFSCVQMRSLQHRYCVEEFPGGRVHLDTLTSAGCVRPGCRSLPIRFHWSLHSRELRNIRWAARVSLKYEQEPRLVIVLHAIDHSGGFDSVWGSANV